MESIAQVVKSKKHYTYALTYPDGKFFYIGKGKGRRIYYHEIEARNAQNLSYKCSTIRKIWALGYRIGKVILASFDTEQEAFQYEIALIFLMDGLTNVHLGGRSVGTGTKRSVEHRRWRSEAMCARGYRISDEHKRKLAESRKGCVRKPLSEETKRKISEAKKGKTPSEETRRKIGEKSRSRIRKPFSEEARRKMSEAQRRRRSRSNMEVA